MLKLLKSSAQAGLLAGLLIHLGSCRHMSDQGPVEMDKIQKNQEKYGNTLYTIIDIDGKNLQRYDKKATVRHYSAPPQSLAKGYKSTVQPDDQLKVLVIDSAMEGAFANAHGPITFGPLTVSEAGSLSVPYAGVLQVQGKTVSEVESMVQKKYSPQFASAQISVSRVSRKNARANVIGLVNRPQQIEISRGGMTVADMVAISGGTKDQPFLCEYNLHRAGRTYRLSNKQVTTKNIGIQDGDLLEVKRNTNLSVIALGSVNVPGAYPIPDADTHLSDLIGAGRGLDIRTAQATGVFVFRNKSKGHTDIYRFNLKDPSGLIYASKFHIHAGDIIYVSEAPLTRWGRMMRNILPLSDISRFANFQRFTN